MKTTVGAIFDALRKFESQREEMIEKQVRGKKTPNYGKTFVACGMLSRVLSDCTLEIELPADAMQILVPLLQGELLRGVTLATADV
jgi:hypothetical protein